MGAHAPQTQPVEPPRPEAMVAVGAGVIRDVRQSELDRTPRARQRSSVGYQTQHRLVVFAIGFPIRTYPDGPGAAEYFERVGGIRGHGSQGQKQRELHLVMVARRTIL